MCDNIYNEYNKKIFLTLNIQPITYLGIQIHKEDFIYKDSDLTLDISKFCNKDKTVSKEITFTLLQNNEADSLELQNKVFEELKSKSNESFLIEKDFNTFKKLSDMTSGITIGAFCNGQLIGQTSVDFTNLKDKKCISKDLNSLVNYYPSGVKGIEYIFEVKGTMIHPDYQGIGIAKKLAKLLEDQIKLKYQQEYNKILLVSEIAVENEPNLKATSKSGFKKLQKYIAFDGVECYLTYKPLSNNLYTFYEAKEIDCNKEKNISILK